MTQQQASPESNMANHLINDLISIIRSLTASKNELINHRELAATSQKKQELSTKIDLLTQAIQRAEAFLASLRQQPRPRPFTPGPITPNPDPRRQEVPLVDPDEEALVLDINKLAPLVEMAITKLNDIDTLQKTISNNLKLLETEIDLFDEKVKNVGKLKSILGQTQDCFAKIDLIIQIETNDIFVPIFAILGKELQGIARIEKRIKAYESKNANELLETEKRDISSILNLIAKLQNFLESGKNAYHTAKLTFERLKGQISDLTEKPGPETPKKKAQAKETTKTIEKIFTSPIINVNNSNVVSTEQSIKKEIKALQEVKAPAKAARSQSKEIFYKKIEQYNSTLSSIKVFSVDKVNELNRGKKITSDQTSFIKIANEIGKMEVVIIEKISITKLKSLRSTLSTKLNKYLAAYEKVYGITSVEAKQLRQSISFQISGLAD